MELIPLVSENNAESTLDSGINASTVTIPLVSGGGSDFPTTYNGTATSAGTATALNDTGIGSSGLSVGDHIYNVTDGSHAVVTAVNTDDVVTTPLEGGSDNTWDSGDEWAANMFVVTMNKRNAGGQVTQQEMALVQERSTDTLTVMAGKRGYGNSSAQSFESGDYVNLFATWELFENIQKLALQNAINLQDKANSSDVTALLNARNWKQSVVCATTAAGTLASDFENGDTVDGITLSTGDRILIKDQVDATENGVYTVNASGAPTRATDFDADSEVVGAVVVVEEGTVNSDGIFICTNDEGDVIGTDNIVFSQYGAGSVATQTQAEEGTNNTTIMSPLRVRQALNIGANNTIPYADDGEDQGLVWDDIFGINSCFGKSNYKTYQLWGAGFSGSADFVAGYNQISIGNNLNASNYGRLDIKTDLLGLLSGETITEALFEGVAYRYLANATYRWGFASAATALYGGAGTQVGFYFDYTDGHLYTTSGVDCGVMTQQVNYRLRMHLTATSFKFYVNDVLIAEDTASLPVVDTVCEVVGIGEIETASDYHFCKMQDMYAAFKIA